MESYFFVKYEKKVGKHSDFAKLTKIPTESSINSVTLYDILNSFQKIGKNGQKRF